MRERERDARNKNKNIFREKLKRENWWGPT
jgi:hypothetical protein